MQTAANTFTECQTDEPKVSFVIPTRNRKADLLDCVRSAFSQTVPAEVLVLDDGSTDGTAEALHEAFPPTHYPHLRYERHSGGNGPCKLRNRGTMMARCEIVFPLDDDAVLSSPETVSQVLREFDHPRVGAVGIPFRNVRESDEVRQRAPDDRHVYAMAAYVGASHAVRRSVFLAAGGYREELFQLGEEGDVCLRMLAQGYVCRASTAAVVEHRQSAVRAAGHQQRLGPRNNVYLAWCNTPLWMLPLHLAATSVNCVVWGWRRGTLGNSAAGVAEGYAMIGRRFRQRQPVCMAAFQLFRALKLGGPRRLEEIEAWLPPRAELPEAPSWKSAGSPMPSLRSACDR